MQCLNNNLKYQLLAYFYDIIPYLIANVFNLDQSYYATLLHLLKKNRYMLTKHELEFNINNLCYASEIGYLLKVNKLFEQGKTSTELQMMSCEYNNKNALHWAVQYGRLPVVKYLVQQGISNDEALYVAATYGQLAVVKYLVEYGQKRLSVSNVNSLNLSGTISSNNLALLLAGKYRHLKVVKYLVSKGANIHANNDQALHMAAMLGYRNIVKYLVEQGANIDVLSAEQKIRFNLN